MSTDEKIIQIQEELQDNYKSKVDSLLSLCESPIEKLFLINFLAYCESKTGLECHTVFLFDYPTTFADHTYSYKSGIKPHFSLRADNKVPWIPQGIEHVEHGDVLRVIPQTMITGTNFSYRVDFLLSYQMPESQPVQIVIECDGHEFHQKSKEQVIKDNAKDRKLAELGFKTLRYSGSELYSKSSFADFKILMHQIEKILNLVLINY